MLHQFLGTATHYHKCFQDRVTRPAADGPSKDGTSSGLWDCQQRQGDVLTIRHDGVADHRLQSGLYIKRVLKTAASVSLREPFLATPFRCLHRFTAVQNWPHTRGGSRANCGSPRSPEKVHFANRGIIGLVGNSSKTLVSTPLDPTLQACEGEPQRILCHRRRNTDVQNQSPPVQIETPVDRAITTKIRSLA